MTLEINLNSAPYFDDFGANNNFHRILFRPSTAVQARELTQLQSILQDQVEKFGKHIFIDGSIIEGCTINFDNRYNYIKILDNYSNGSAIPSLSDFQGKKVVSTIGGLEAIIVNTVSGFETASPDLNTLYIKYLNSGQYANGLQQQTFDPDQIVQIKTTANIAYANVTIANSSVNAIGKGYSLNISEGTVFQKGFFIRVDPQTVIVEKYNNLPNNISVGFRTYESIVTSDTDGSLLDNALGASNYNAPGANRLKLVANLVIRTTDNTSITSATANTDNFFSIVDFESGVPTIVRTDPQYAQLGNQLAKRTYEESGHYIIDPFEMSVAANTSNNTYHSLIVDKGLGYVSGHRVEFLNKKSIPIKKGIDTVTIDGQTITTGYGNYVLVNEYVGSFDPDNIVKVSLRNAVANSITAGTFTTTTIPGSEIGSAYIRSVKYSSGTPGANTAEYKMYLFNINMNSGQNFDSARSITYVGAGLANSLADFILTNSSPTIIDASLDRLVFPLGPRAISNTSTRSYISRQNKTITFTGGVATFTPTTETGATTEFYDVGNPLTTAQEDNFIIVPTTTATGVVIGKPISMKTIGSIVSTSSSVTITTGIVQNFSAIVYYNIIRKSSDPIIKKSLPKIFVGIQANTHPSTTTGPWCLGIPDAYRLRGVYQGTTFDANNTNNVSKFVLDTGQRDSFYGHAFLSIKPGSGHTLATDDRLLVEIDCFNADTTSGRGYFTIDSYPIDDSSSPAANTINTAEVPIFTSSSGSIIDLRDAIDFRTITSNTANLSTSNTNATINPATTIAYNTTAAYIPIPDALATTSIKYYLGRKDKITLSPSGKINIIDGIPSLYAITPKDQEGAMTLGVVTIPPYPSLTQAQSKTYNRVDYLITTNLQQHRRYTMRDVGVIDKRVNNLEYYTLLSSLESQADRLLITDSAGLNRFKNGIYVDSFNDFSISDTGSSEFKCAIDTTASVLRPQFVRSYIELSNKTLSNVVQKGKNLILDYTNKSLASQPFASKVRNCAESMVFVWKGGVNLNPDGDHVPDTKYNPDINIDIDLATPFLKLQEGGFFNTKYGDWNTTGLSTSSRIINESISTEQTGERNWEVFKNITTSVTTQATQARDVINTNFNAYNQTFDFGEIVQDVTVQPFLRSKRIIFIGTGLKPNTIVYPFFDEVLMSTRCKTSNTSFSDVGAFGSTLKTDSIGTVYGIFYLPENTFKVGERVFKLVDVNDLVVGAEVISTIATGRYTGSNIMIAKANAKVNVTNVGITQTLTEETQSIIVDQNTTTDSTLLFRYDPIAQSFIVDNLQSGVPGIYMTKIDLYFYEKDSTLGVEVQIREVDENTGYPTPKIVPYGRKVLTTSEINTSTDGSIATTITFDSPLYLENQRQYCFVVMPIGNNTNTKIWVAEIGGTDIATNSPIYTNNSMGDLFTSSTNKAWKIFTKEDIKCTIYRAEFSSQTGAITYKNSPTEYLSVNNHKGNFITGEAVYVSNGTLQITSGANVQSTSNSISTGTTTAQTAFALNNYIFISSNTNTINDIRKIVALPNTSTITVDSNLSFTDNNASIGILRGNGSLTGFIDYNNPSSNDLYITSSTADGTNYFDNNTNCVVIGAASGARANVITVDDVYYDVIVPQLSMAKPAGTFVNLAFNGLANTSTTKENTSTRLQNDSEIELVDFERRVLSRSREITLMGGVNSLEMTASISSTDNKISPMFNDIKKSMLVIRNNISSSSTASVSVLASDETQSGGGSLVTSKYVTKKVILAEGQDAEDLEIYLTANKPDGTDIYVYAKFLGAEDSELFENKRWTQLTQFTPTNVVGSKVNFSDYKEYRYQLPSAIGSTVSTTAYKNTTNSNIIRYYTINGASVDSFKIFTIKIVMVSDVGPHIIPRIADMRAIALQV